MTHDQAVALTAALIIAMGAVLLLLVIPGPCRCNDCVKHTRERVAAADVARAKRHREHHTWSGTPWGEECNLCKDGGERDKP